MQIEYALAAVSAGAPAVGILASNGVVIATEHKHKSILYDERSVHKVEIITDHIGMVYSGMGPDYRLLVKEARRLAQKLLFDVSRTDTRGSIGATRCHIDARVHTIGWCTSIRCVTVDLWLGQ